MNILILTGKFGMGHWSVSQSIRQQLEHSFPGANVEIKDFLSYALPRLSEAIYKSFNLMVSHGSLLFNLYYELTAQMHPDARPPFEPLLLDKLAELLGQCRPDAVIATHPLCAQLVSRLKSRYDLDLPLITCVTDISSHPEWINRYTDCYLVPDEKVSSGLKDKGVDSSLICVTGIPVREEFYRRKTTCSLNHKLLIMGGGLGLLPKGSTFYDALNCLPDTHTTIITGHNRKMYERLHGRWENIEVLGYTSKVWDYMSDADLIISKPGGITLFEAISSQVPILAWQPVLAQERRNANWLTSEGIGWVAEKKNMISTIHRLLSDCDRLSEAANKMEVLRAQMESDSLVGLLETIEWALKRRMRHKLPQAAIGMEAI